MSSLSSISNAIQSGFRLGAHTARKYPLVTGLGVFGGVVLLKDIVRCALSWKSLVFCGGMVSLYYGYRLGKYYLIDLPPIKARLRAHKAETDRLMAMREAQEVVFGAYTMVGQTLSQLPPQELN